LSPRESAWSLQMLFQTPWRDGYSPVWNVARAGQQWGDGQKALVNVSPSAAIRVRLGVIVGCSLSTVSARW